MAGQTHATEGERGATEGAATRELALIGIGAGDPDWITLEATGSPGDGAVEITVAESLYINLDGEPLEGDHLRFEARPGALRVHLPADSPVLGASRRG